MYFTENGASKRLLPNSLSQFRLSYYCESLFAKATCISHVCFQAKSDQELRHDRLNRLARGEAGDSEYSSSSSSSSDSENDEEIDQDEVKGMQNGDYFNENLRQHEDVPLGEESTRLALVNMDWEHLKALDILALIQSFVSSTGSVTSVIIYLSDFGKKRLELENQMGPTGVYSMSRHADANRNLTAIREHLPGNSSTVADGFGLDIEKVRQYEKDK